MFSNGNDQMRQIETEALEIKKALEVIYGERNDRLPIETQDENTAFSIAVQLFKGQRNLDRDAVTALGIVKQLISKWKQLQQMQNVTSNMGSFLGGNQQSVGIGSGANFNLQTSNAFGSNVGVEDDSFINFPGESSKDTEPAFKHASESIPDKKKEITIDNVADFYEPAEDSKFKPLIDESKYSLSFTINENDEYEYRVIKK